MGTRIALARHAATGEKGWFGLPLNELHEKLAQMDRGRLARRAEGGRPRSRLASGSRPWPIAQISAARPGDTGPGLVSVFAF
ncbi:MAG: hypothetical protein K0R61_2921 [Microvirga sp.]|nr:hypothetical protein [Microvirga sp.]